MDSSQDASSSRFHPSALLNHPWGVAAVWALVLLTQAATLGISDDEAYYWVLSQRPALGYAYHPPMVAWVITLFEWPLRFLAQPWGGIPETLRPLVLRLPAVVVSSLLVGALLSWLAARQSERRLGSQALGLFSLAGVFGLAWMMVPDQPLFLGWLFLFSGTFWALSSHSARLGFGEGALLFGGAVLCILSKFSGILAVGSAGLLFLLNAQKSLRLRLFGVTWLLLGTALSVAVIVSWNLSRDGGALAYQLRGRQTGGLSLIRGLRFWALQVVLCGPMVLWVTRAAAGEILLGLRDLVRFRGRIPALRDEQMMALWVFPPLLVFGVQPFFAEFKAHWIFIAWLPGILFFLLRASERWRKVQLVWGLGILSLLWAVPQFPILSWLQEKNPWRSVSAPAADPRLDLSFDLQGWSELRERVRELRFKRGLGDAVGVQVVGSRYQTASQAAWALGNVDQASLLPVEVSQVDEWPLDPSLVAHHPEGRNGSSSWPRLLRPVFYVSDERYDGLPQFPGAACELIDQFAPTRMGYRGKRIELRLCAPEGSVPRVR